MRDRNRSYCWRTNAPKSARSARTRREALQGELRLERGRQHRRGEPAGELGERVLRRLLPARTTAYPEVAPSRSCSHLPFDGKRPQRERCVRPRRRRLSARSCRKADSARHRRIGGEGRGHVAAEQRRPAPARRPIRHMVMSNVAARCISISAQCATPAGPGLASVRVPGWARGRRHEIGERAVGRRAG